MGRTTNGSFQKGRDSSPEKRRYQQKRPFPHELERDSEETSISRERAWLPLIAINVYPCDENFGSPSKLIIYPSLPFECSGTALGEIKFFSGEPWPLEHNTYIPKSGSRCTRWEKRAMSGNPLHYSHSDQKGKASDALIVISYSLPNNSTRKCF